MGLVWRIMNAVVMLKKTTPIYYIEICPWLPSWGSRAPLGRDIPGSAAQGQPLQTQKALKIGNCCQDNWVMSHARGETWVNKPPAVHSFWGKKMSKSGKWRIAEMWSQVCNVRRASPPPLPADHLKFILLCNRKGKNTPFLPSSGLGCP